MRKYFDMLDTESLCYICRGKVERIEEYEVESSVVLEVVWLADRHELQRDSSRNVPTM